MCCAIRIYKITAIASLLDCMYIVVFVVVFIFILEMFNQIFSRRDVTTEYPGKPPCQWSRKWKGPRRTSRPYWAGWRTL